MKFVFYQLTSVGNRKSNQDYMMNIINDDFALFVVADGLGGHQAGERAASYFCHSLIKLAGEYAKKINQNPETIMAGWVSAAIDMMFEAFEGDTVASEAHTTCAILYLNQERVVTAHCGDSRIYRMNRDKLLWRSRDHSLTQLLHDRGELSEQNMGIHPEQNQLTRSINVLKIHAPEIKTYPRPKTGETFILCSDGFWEFTKRNEFLRLAQPFVEKNDIMKQARLSVLRAGGNSDNVTVQWIRVH